MSKGHFIVIDGTDGSGKKTQSDLLVERLTSLGKTVHLADFPQYGTYSAVFVEKYLNGHFGSDTDVSAKQASLFYALDRYAAAAELRAHLEAGTIIVSNRYTSANMGHQGGKMQNPEERKAFIDWLLDLEFNILGIPRPTCTIFLHVPHAVGMELVKQKTMQRDYIEGNEAVDIHEKNSEHLRNAEESYIYAAEQFDDWTTISCINNHGTLRTREDIHEEIWEMVRREIGL